MISQKDHPELYAAKLRRLDRTISKLVAEYRLKEFDCSIEHVHQQAKISELVDEDRQKRAEGQPSDKLAEYIRQKARVQNSPIPQETDT